MCVYLRVRACVRACLRAPWQYRREGKPILRRDCALTSGVPCVPPITILASRDVMCAHLGSRGRDYIGYLALVGELLPDCLSADLCSSDRSLTTGRAGTSGGAGEAALRRPVEREPTVATGVIESAAIAASLSRHAISTRCDCTHDDRAYIREDGERSLGP